MPEPGKTPPKDVHSSPLAHRAVHRYGLGDVQGHDKGSRKVARSRYCPAVGRKAAPQPAEARAEAVGHDGNDQQRGRGMVTNAGSKPTANSDRSHTRVIFEGTSQRLRISRILGLPPESRPGIVRLIRHAWKGAKLPVAKGISAEISARRSTGPGRRRLVQAPTAVSPYHARESTEACHPAARHHSLKRTSRHAVPPL